MPIVKLPVKGKVYQNVDQLEIPSLSPYMMDGRVDETGCALRRPGLLEWIDLGTSAPIDGLVWDNIFHWLWALSNGQLFKVTDIAGTKTDITSDPLLIGTRLSSVNNGTYGVFANGGRMVTATSGGTTTYIAAPLAPTQVSQLAYMDGYVFANEFGTGRFHWCEVDDVLTWNGLNLITAERSPDILTCLAVNSGEIMAGGPLSVENFWNDGITPIARVDGGYIERGVLAPYSLLLADNTAFWFDYERKVTRLDRRTPKVISFPFDRIFGGLTSATSVISNHLTVGGLNYTIWHFPDDSRTFAYDYALDDWSEWGYWNVGTATYEDFLCHTFSNCRDWGFYVAGSRIDGKIYKISRDYYDDDGNPMRTERRTGWIDHGTHELKRSNSLSITLKRGQGISGSSVEPTLAVQFRDDGDASWSNEYTLSLGLTGDTTIRLSPLKNLGMYYQRQWRFSVSDAVQFILLDAEEDVEVVSNPMWRPSA